MARRLRGDHGGRPRERRQAKRERDSYVHHDAAVAMHMGHKKVRGAGEGWGNAVKAWLSDCHARVRCTTRAS